MLEAVLVSMVLLGAEPAPAAPPPEYRVSLEGTSAELVLGARGELRFSIEARADKKVNLKSPLRVELTSEQLRFDQARLEAKDAQGDERAVRFSTRFQADAAGPASLSLRALFFICDDRVCERKTVSLEHLVQVRLPAKSDVDP